MVAGLVTLVPWDDAERGIPSRFVDHPQFSWSVPEHTRRLRAPVPLRLDEAGGLHLLGDGILHLGGRGRTPLSGPVADFACDAAGDCVVLENGRLRGLDAAGAELWAADGEFTRVISSRFAEGAGGVIELDGGPRRTLPAAGPVFLGGGRLVSVFFDDARELRGIVARDPDGGTTEVAGTDALYPWLVHPFGADGEARLYVWRDGRIARVGLDGEIEVLGAVDGIAVRGDQVFTSHRAGDQVVVSEPGGETHLDAAGFRLVHVDPAGNLYLLGDEGPGSAGTLRVHAPDGRLESSGPPPEDLAAIDCRVPLHRDWQVAADGRVVIPVVTPDGVAVVQLASRA